MDKESPSRKKFLQILGLTTGAAIINSGAGDAHVNKPDIRMLKGEHTEFMARYEKWMDEYIDAIRIRKADPDNVESHKTIAALSHKAVEFKPELAQYMQDETFALYFGEAIKRMSNEI